MKKIFTTLLFLYFLSLIIFRQNYNSITWIIDIILIIFYSLKLANRADTIKFNYIIVLFSSFVILSTISAFYGIDFDSSMYRIMPLFLLSINLFIIYNLIIEYKLINVVFQSILFGAFINYLIAFEILTVPFPIYFGNNITNYRLIGTLGNPNVFSTFMLISMIISFIYIFQKNKLNTLFYYYQYINILLALYMILLSVSKQGIIMSILLLIGYFFIIPKDKKQWGIIILIIIGSVAMMYNMDFDKLTRLFDLIMNRFDFMSNTIASNSNNFNSTGIRKALILFGLEAFQENPLFGIGIGNFHIISTVLPSSQSGKWAENNYIELLVDVGIFGMILFYTMYIYTLYKIKFIVKKNLKYLLYYSTFLLLLMDLSSVTYIDKFTIYFLLLISIIIEYETNISKEKGIYYEKN